MAKRTTTAVADDLKPVVEALIFASDEPLSTKQLRVLIEGEKKSKKKKPAAVAEVEPVGSAGGEMVAPGDQTEGDEVPSRDEALGTTGELEALDTEPEEKGGLDAR